MSRIGATISGLDQYFLSHLKDVDNEALKSAIRLATGKQVPKPSYDPAAFFMISSFENHLNVVESTKTQVDLAANLGSESQLVLDQTRSNLQSIRDALLLDEDLSLSSDDRNIQQATIDAAIIAIRDLARTEINGRRVFDGSSNYTVSGRNSAQIQGVQVFSLGAVTEFSGTVTSAATKILDFYQGASGGISTGDATFTITGNRGSAVISVTDGESLEDVEARVNASSHLTGIEADINPSLPDRLYFRSLDFGDDALLEIDVNSGAFATTRVSTGQDAVVSINGETISSDQVDGNRVTYAKNGTHVVFEFDVFNFADGIPAFTGDFDSVTISDERTQKFALTPDITKRSTFAIQGIHPELLGGISGTLDQLASGGSLSGLGDNTAFAIRVVDEALSKLTVMEGQVDAFADVTVASASKLLTDFSDDIKNTLESISEVNEDEESLKLAKSQTLASSTLSALAIVQQQRFNTLGLLQLLAGI
ncbi:MAG: hypothetical protein H6822_19995 [Planctomycetaceae bacterium]|nr:hypothetical protein [Planctomycetales bacterium]MCB9924471.1 hypothetical protein [Planctomycetaceae bacterium]